MALTKIMLTKIIITTHCCSRLSSEVTAWGLAGLMVLALELLEDARIVTQSSSVDEK